MQAVDEIRSVTLSGCRCDSKDSPNGRRYIISRIDGKPLSPKDTRLELIAEDKDPWTAAFQEIGMYNNIGDNILNGGTYVKRKRGVIDHINV
jgi:hypothetical protein